MPAPIVREFAFAQGSKAKARRIVNQQKRTQQRIRRTSPMGTALSRWTMAFFAAALVFLLAAETMMAARYGFPAVPVEAPETLILVHTATIGWLSLLMCGALLQFVPVLVARPLRAGRLVMPAQLCLLSGLASLICGFLNLAGTIATDLPLLPSAAVLLPAGFLLIGSTVCATLWSVRPSRLPLQSRFVAVGVVCLFVAVALGALFALSLSGLLPFDARATGLPIHAVAGFGGWLTFSAIGVSYRLLPMFMLSPEKERATSKAVWWCGVAALLSVLGGLLESLAGGPGVGGLLAAMLATAMLVLYGVDLVFFYRNRKRRRVELNVRAAGGAFFALFASALLFCALVATGALERHVGALVYLVAFGWLTGLGLSQLYKIVPFLTWLECYGGLMGKQPTPRVQDLVVERRGQIWFALYFAAVAGGCVALLLEAPSAFRLASVLMLAATLAIVAELVAARRLVYVPPGKRLPDGAERPHLFLPQFR
jgi:hypothetical protein